MRNFIISSGVTELQIRIAIYRSQRHIVGFFINAGDHNHIAAGALDIIHIAAVHPKQKNVDVAIHPHQRQVIVFLNRFVHLIHDTIHVVPYDCTHDDDGQKQNDHNQCCDLIACLHFFDSLHQRLLRLFLLLHAAGTACFPVFVCSAHSVNIPLFFLFLATLAASSSNIF